MKIRVFLADDHAVVRAGLRALLEASGEIEVVGEGATGREALDGIEREQPDVAVLDVHMPELGGIEAAEWVHERRPQVKVIMLSAATDVESVHRALAAGAAGYVPKFAAGSEVVAAIRKVHAGGRYLAQSIAEAVVDGYARQLKDKAPLETLSRRERQVLQLIAEGRSAAEIGKLVSLSPRTIETYRARIYEKLGLKDSRELVIFAVKQGLLVQR
jgi:two-component system, NarL family, response regulator NreC